MNEPQIEIDSWLAMAGHDQDDSNTVWEPGFDADRQIVHSKMGPYTKIFLRPEKFVKRFYQTIYPLTIEEWECVDQVKLYDGFCTIDTILDIRFQATFNYAQSNLEILTELNEHIKESYLGLILDVVNRELLNLSDGSWVHEGLESIERKISINISEMLILQNIQSQVICKLKPSFEEFPDVQFARENVYLSVLKKSFEFSDQQKDEVFRQQQEQESQKINHKRQQFKQINEVAELDRQRQALQSENSKKLLRERAIQQQEQFEIKKSIHADKLKHNIDLKEMMVVAELEEKEKSQALLIENELQEKKIFLLHHAEIKGLELEEEISEFEREKEGWREIKSKTHAEELDFKHRRKQLEFDTDVGYKKRYEIQRLAMQEESFAVRKKSDTYLKREIELLELEKRKLALQASIQSLKTQDKIHQDSSEQGDQ